MSVTVYSEIVGLDELVPRTTDYEREDQDVERLSPWVFQHACIAKDNCTTRWPREQGEFKDFFCLLNSHLAELEESSDLQLESILRASETITLPRENWKVLKREYFTLFIKSQGMMLRILMETICLNLEGFIKQSPELHFPIFVSKQKYVIGGKQYATRPEGATMIGSQDDPLPVISYAGWFEGQIWSKFLGEILSTMLGHLAQSISVGFQDQEVFIIGFHGPYIYIVRGYFTTNQVSRVQSGGFSETEVFELKFTRGYNLCLKEDWLKAMRALVRLLRYIMSGNAKISAVRADLHRSAAT